MEMALSTQPVAASDVPSGVAVDESFPENQFYLEGTRALWRSILYVWSDNVWIGELSARFLKLSAQLVLRYIYWLEKGLAISTDGESGIASKSVDTDASGGDNDDTANALESSSNANNSIGSSDSNIDSSVDRNGRGKTTTDSATGNNSASSTSKGSWTQNQVPFQVMLYIFADVSKLKTKVELDLVNLVLSRVSSPNAGYSVASNAAQLRAKAKTCVQQALAPCSKRLSHVTPLLREAMATVISRKGMTVLQAVPRIQSTYLANKQTPTSPSDYVTKILAALESTVLHNSKNREILSNITNGMKLTVLLVFLFCSSTVTEYAASVILMYEVSCCFFASLRLSTFYSHYRGRVGSSWQPCSSKNREKVREPDKRGSRSCAKN